jgi:hypothetical protein
MAEHFRIDPRLYAILERYPGIIAIPPNLDRVFVIPPRPGPDPAPERVIRPL